ncbi:MAG: chorismate synthase [Candidatus Bathyarchaeia archaeon]
MNSNTLGKVFTVTCFGESHGRCVGVVIDGCPSGLKIDDSDIQREVDRRVPKDSLLVSGRVEEDKVEILSGIYRGYTTGAPLTALVWNRDSRPGDYEGMVDTPRPGHADYPASVKFGGFSDLRGGGRWSGRMTVALIIAGAVAKRLLNQHGVEVLAYTSQVGNVVASRVSVDEIRMNTYTNPIRTADLNSVSRMVEEILAAKSQGDSVGSIVDFTALNVPVGLGEPFFDPLDADLAKALFTIPGVKGVEFGSGFRTSAMRGSENNDGYTVENGRVVTLTNNSGGILGGMSNGMPITGRVAFKPPPSIAKRQKTIDLRRLVTVEISVGGRHDPCIAPKAVPVIESTISIVLVDHMLRSGILRRIVKS